VKKLLKFVEDYAPEYQFLTEAYGECSQYREQNISKAAYGFFPEDIHAGMNEERNAQIQEAEQETRHGKNVLFALPDCLSEDQINRNGYDEFNNNIPNIQGQTGCNGLYQPPQPSERGNKAYRNQNQI
jgi:hypothetical protein